MINKIPYSYYLYHIPTKSHYYGIRHAKDCNPDELWVTYFSSSKIVHRLIKEYGPDSFVFSVRKIFSDSKTALLWEHKVLTRLDAATRTDWINRHNGGTKFRSPLTHSTKTRKLLSRKLTGRKLTDEHKQKMRESALVDRERRCNAGWKMSPQSRANISNGIKRVASKIYTPERNAKMAESKRGMKRKYLPDGSFIMVKPNSH